jgi:hypothetical protein
MAVPAPELFPFTGFYAVTCWLDAPVNIVMVVDVRPADR